MKKIICLLLYYSFARYLPVSYIWRGDCKKNKIFPLQKNF